MREFTDKEKILTNTLIQNISSKTGFRIGDILLQAYPIEYIEKNKSDEPFYKKTITICHKAGYEIESEIYEAFSLIITLIEHRYIVAKEFLAKDIIGKKYPYCYPIEDRHEIRTYFNYYNTDLWKLLNSHYSVTNSLIDFAKDFKTIEQRRYEEELVTTQNTLKKTRCALMASWCSFFIAIVSLILTILIPQKLSKVQMNSIINAIQEQKSISIDHFPNIIPDTLNVKLTESLDKQPINLNVTVKPDQQTKMQ